MGRLAGPAPFPATVELLSGVGHSPNLEDPHVGHELLQDLDDPGHLLVVSRWESREHADQVLAEYAGHPSAVEASRLVSRPRRRFVAAGLPQ